MVLDYQSPYKFLIKLFDLTMSRFCLGKLNKILENSSVLKSFFLKNHTEYENMLIVRFITWAISQQFSCRILNSVSFRSILDVWPE